MPFSGSQYFHWAAQLSPKLVFILFLLFQLNLEKKKSRSQCPCAPVPHPQPLKFFFQYWILEYFHQSRKKACRISSHTSSIPILSLQPSATISLLSVFMDLPILVRLCICVYNTYILFTNFNIYNYIYIYNFFLMHKRLGWKHSVTYKGTNSSSLLFEIWNLAWLEKRRRPSVSKQEGFYTNKTEFRWDVNVPKGPGSGSGEPSFLGNFWKEAEICFIFSCSGWCR